MIDWTPDPIAISIGPVTIFWYGVMYALGLAASFFVIEREARRRGLDTGILVNGMIIVAVAALIGGRLYHVIDQWDRYKDDLAAIVLPPYSGLGVYGGIVTGFIAAYLYARWKRQPFLTWADCIAPGLLVMQAVARWGNFFNQELYGPPTNLPWGIAIECANRTPTWACPPLGDTPVDAHFHPLFLYESISGAIGAVVLLLIARRVRWLRPGDVFLLFMVWYGATRFLLEPLRSNNWTFYDVPVASLISATFVLGALAILAWRHRPGASAGERAAREAAAGAAVDGSPADAATPLDGAVDDRVAPLDGPSDDPSATPDDPAGGAAAPPA
jgi:phosphatidylglycerol:prolipoprotein diacylglycerol transferase